MPCSGWRAVSSANGYRSLRLPQLLCLLSRNSLLHLNWLVSWASSSRRLDWLGSRFSGSQHLLTSRLISLGWPWRLFWVPDLVAAVQRLLRYLLWASNFRCTGLVVRSSLTILSLLDQFTFHRLHFPGWIFPSLSILAKKLAHWLVLHLGVRLD